MKFLTLAYAGVILIVKENLWQKEAVQTAGILPQEAARGALALFLRDPAVTNQVRMGIHPVQAGEIFRLKTVIKEEN